MKEDPFNTSIDPELQARIVSLILGEASVREREELEQLFDKQPELRAFQVKLESMHKLLCEVAKDEFPASNENWRLSAEKRNAVLAVISPGETQQSLPRPVYPVSTKKKLVQEFNLATFAKIAAVFCVVAFLGVLANSKLGVRPIEIAAKRDSVPKKIGDDFVDSLESRSFSSEAEIGAKSDRRYFSRDPEKSELDLAPARDSESELSKIRKTLGELSFGNAVSDASDKPMPSSGPQAGRTLDRVSGSDLSALSSPVPIPAPAQTDGREKLLREQATKNAFNENSTWSMNGYTRSDEERNLRTVSPDAKGLYEQASRDNYVLDMSVANKPFDSVAPKSPPQPPSSPSNLSRLGSGQLSGGVSLSVPTQPPGWGVTTNPIPLEGKALVLGEPAAVTDMKTEAESKKAAQANESAPIVKEKGLEQLSEMVVDQVAVPAPVGGTAILDGDKSTRAQFNDRFGTNAATPPTASPSAELTAALPSPKPVPQSEPKGDKFALGNGRIETRNELPSQNGQSAEPPLSRLELRDGISLKKESGGVPQSTFRFQGLAKESQRDEGINFVDSQKTPVQPHTLYFNGDAKTGDNLPDEKSRGTASGKKISELTDNLAWYGSNGRFDYDYIMGGTIRGISKPSAIPDGLAELNALNDRFSTFSLHVSDVSFKLAQAALAKGEWPEAAKIRIEEFVNAFDYGDPLPRQDEKIACRVEQTIHPFLQQRNLLRVSMRTSAAGRASSIPLRLTFILDHSGSMERVDRQQTIRRAFATLASQLQSSDQVTLISFARQPRLLADRVSGTEANELVQLIESLPSEGGTNIEAALQLAFEKAKEQYTDGAQNRMVLLTDGAVNLGDADPERLSQMVTSIRDAGIAFDAAGISADGLNDEVLEALSRKGDGRYYLLDSVEAADKGFAQQIAGALRPSAKNVKVQVEFNPSRVGQYKLLGFEKHILNQEDFRNDKVDAAEMAAAEAGVAIYQFEAKPNGEGDVGTVFVRFQDLTTGSMIENRWPIPYEADVARPEQASPSMRVSTSAAMFAAKLRGEPLGGTVELKMLTELLSSLPSQHLQCQRIQQLRVMINQAQQIHGK